MKKVFCVLGLMAIICMFSAVSLQAATLNVPASYPTIQAAINAAISGDTINVAAGTYVEAVNVNKSLTLIGAAGAIIKPDNSTPLLDGGVRRVAVYINAVDNVTVDGFEIDGTGGAVHLGIYGFNSNNTTVKNNVVHNMIDDPVNHNAGIGIIFYGWGQGIDNALIQDNTVSLTDHHGIWIGAVDGSGTTALVSTGNVIKGNTVHHTWQNTNALPPSGLWGGAIGMDNANNGTIHGNSTNDTGWNQREIMLINGASNVSITDNILAHSNGTQAASDGWMQSAIEIVPPASNMTITGNNITTNTVALSGAYGWVLFLPNVTGISSFNNNTITLTGSAPAIGSYLHGLVLNTSNYPGAIGDWTIQGNTFQGGNLGLNSTAIRLYVENLTSTISISDNTINGWVNGIRSSLDNAGNLTIHQNSFTNNTDHGIFNDTPPSVTIDAACNWWGAANGPGDVGTGSGDRVSDYVTFAPWLASPGGACSTTPPNAPTGVWATMAATKGSGASATVNFSAPWNPPGAPGITGYTVTSNPGGVTATGAASPLTVSGLAYGTSYTFRVTATNSVGLTSAPSAPSIAKSKPLPTPSAPTGVRATPGNASATVTFSAPWNPGGPGIAIASYTVTSTPGGFTATGAASPLTVTGLTNGTSYTFKVTATNDVTNPGPQTSALSTASAAVKPLAPTPSAPTGVLATMAATKGSGASATVNFNAPWNPGGPGITITSYTVTSTPGNVTATGATSPLTVSGLNYGTSYTFRVTATNSVGLTSAPSTASTAKIQPLPMPSAPTGVWATPGNQKATVHWAAPWNTGGTGIAIASYAVKAYQGITLVSTTQALGTATQVDVTVLTNGTAYTFRVTATNDVTNPGPQTSAPSAPSVAVKPRP